MAEQKEIIVVCDFVEGSVARVEQRLREIGFKVEKVLNSTGSIIGFWDKSLLTLRELPEVVDVSESETKFSQ